MTKPKLPPLDLPQETNLFNFKIHQSWGIKDPERFYQLMDEATSLVVSGHYLGANPNVVKAVFDNRGRALYFSRSPLPFWRDGGEPYFYKHIGIYAYRVGFLQTFVTLAPGRWEVAEKLEQLRALEHGFAIHVVETAGDTLEVDTPEDLARVEAYLSSRV